MASDPIVRTRAIDPYHGANIRDYVLQYALPIQQVSGILLNI